MALFSQLYLDHTQSEKKWVSKHICHVSAMVTAAFYDAMTKRAGRSCGNWGVSGQLCLGIPITHLSLPGTESKEMRNSRPELAAGITCLRGGGQALGKAEKEVQELPHPLQSFSKQQRQNILFLTVFWHEDTVKMGKIKLTELKDLLSAHGCWKDASTVNFCHLNLL